MKSLCLYATLFFSLLAFEAHAEDFFDIFPGTLVIYQNNPVLIRCDLVNNAYVLVGQNLEKDAFLKQIKELGSSIESPVSAVVYAKYKEIDGINHLVVKEITEVEKGNSCHLFLPREPLNMGMGF